MPGFTTPGLLFFGAVEKGERDFCKQVYEELRAKGYNRFVEVCSGALAMSLTAVSGGWNPSQIEASDVTLFSSVIGYMVADKDLTELDVRLEGDPIDLDGDQINQAATILYEELLARTQVKDDIHYWAGLANNLVKERSKHIESFRGKLGRLKDTLGGLSYESLDMWEHLDRVADDPRTVINANPPSYYEGYDKLFDTGGRITWNEPEFLPFDPDTGYPALRDYMKDRAALIVNLEEHQPPKSKENPLYVRNMGNGTRAYLLSNRPEEILPITGGPRVAKRKNVQVNRSLHYPVIPLDYEITTGSTIESIKANAEEADYYRELWMHKFITSGVGYNLLYLVDGYAFGIVGLSLDPLLFSHSEKSAWKEYAMLRFSFGAAHNTYRLTRLSTMLALRKEELGMFRSPQTALYIDASVGLITNERTKYPEVKGLRGIMKKVNKKTDNGMNNLIYAAPWSSYKSRDELLAAWLKKEEQWRKNSPKA